MSHPVSVPRRAYRARRGRVLGGVARGLSNHLGWPVGLVRAGFVLLALTGFGLILYAAYWAWLPLEDAGPDPEGGGRDMAGVLGLGALAIGAMLLLSANGIDLFSSWLTPIVLVGIGLAVIWRQSDDTRRATLLSDVGASARATTATALRRGGPRVLLGLALVLLGVLAALVGRVDLGASIRGLAAVLLAAVGLALVLLPWGLGWWRDLESERRARIRSEERAEVAAQVHDSVLQTLTLIQRSSQDPDEVVRLARTEERALRSWLYAPTGDPEATFAAALEREIGDVEASYPCQVDFVHVGDVARDDRVDALVAASREAIVNAAKHAGGAVSVYAECTDDQVDVFVRDRGKGFDVDAVPEDRLGLRESVHARMARVGGAARVRSAVGEGTEVALTLPVGVRSWT